MIIPRFTNVNRKAILIGNSDSGGDFLPGVSKDIAGLKNFILSPNGGSWCQNEIIEIVHKKSKEDLLKLLKECDEKNDYLFIFFGGHGQLSTYRVPAFVLPGGDTITLNEIKSQVQRTPTLMISDSCQGLPRLGDGGLLGESQKLFSDSYDPVKEFKARRLFDKAIRSLPPIFTYASAVTPGEFSNESSNGGYYTQALLKACKSWLTDKIGGDVIGIVMPHLSASLAVKKQSNNTQHPYIEGYTRSYQPPFIIKV